MIQPAPLQQAPCQQTVYQLFFPQCGLLSQYWLSRYALHSPNLSVHSSSDDERLLKGIRDARLGH